MKQKKFRQGTVLTPEQAVELISAGRYVYWRHKPQHPGWMLSMRLNSVIGAARMGLLREAILNEEPKQ